jgi:hypothetical protein
MGESSNASGQRRREERARGLTGSCAVRHAHVRTDAVSPQARTTTQGSRSRPLCPAGASGQGDGGWLERSCCKLAKHACPRTRSSRLTLLRRLLAHTHAPARDATVERMFRAILTELDNQKPASHPLTTDSLLDRKKVRDRVSFGRRTSLYGEYQSRARARKLTLKIPPAAVRVPPPQTRPATTRKSGQ